MLFIAIPLKMPTVISSTEDETIWISTTLCIPLGILQYCDIAIPGSYVTTLC